MSSGDCRNERVPRGFVGDLCVRDMMVKSPKTVPDRRQRRRSASSVRYPHILTALLVDGQEFAGVIERDGVPAEASDKHCGRDRACRDVATIESDAPMVVALRRLDERSERRLVVLDPDGRTLRGLLCLTSDRDGFCQSEQIAH